MNASHTLQNSIVALRRSISLPPVHSSRSKTSRRRPRRCGVTERSFFTTRDIHIDQTRNKHLKSQDGNHSVQFVSWRPAERFQEVLRLDRACKKSPGQNVGLGWPSLNQCISGYDDLRKRRPEKIGFSISYGKDNNAGEKPQHSDQGVSNAALEQTIDNAIQKNDPYRLLSAMVDASTSGLLGDMSAYKFRSTLPLLGPKHFISPYRQSIAVKDGELTRKRSFPYVTSMFRRYVESLLKLMGCRRTSGCGLGLEEYKLLLMAAASARQQDLASHIWIAMLEDDLEPDLEAYNSLFEALCYASTHVRHEQVRLRLIPLNALPHRRPSSLDSPSSYSFGTGGLRETVMYWYNHMCNRGIMPDADTYSFVMVALGRVRYIDDVKRLVRGTWDIDLDNIPSAEKRLRETLKPSIEPSCAPKPSTLRHLMHVLCINNQLPEAVRSVEYMAEQYSLQIPSDAWEELVLWTGAFSAHRTNPQLSNWKGYGMGQLKKVTMRETWDTIRGGPYNVKPTLRMLDALCSSASRRMALREMLDYVREGLHIYRHRLRVYLQALHDQAEGIVLEQSLASKSEPQSSDSKTHSRYQLHHAVQVARAEEYVAFSAISRWFRLLLRGDRFMGHKTIDSIVDWDRQVVPDLLQELWHFRSPRTYYSPQQLDRQRHVHGQGEIEFNAEESDLEDWEDLQSALESLSSLSSGDSRNLTVCYALEKRLKACKRRGIDNFITETLGPEKEVKLADSPPERQTQTHATNGQSPITEPSTPTPQTTQAESQNLCQLA